MTKNRNNGKNGSRRDAEHAEFPLICHALKSNQIHSLFRY